MNIPAYTSPNLCLGRAYDAETSSPGNDIFHADDLLGRKIYNVNKFSFKYRVVKTNKDVKDLLDISGELSLKIKANILSVGGAGKYLNENNTEEGTSQLVAVLKCTTVSDTMDGSAKPKEELATGQLSEHLGTHYVRSVMYGAEMVASVKFESSNSTTKKDVIGEAEGKLNTLGTGNFDFKGQLTKLTSKCEDTSRISITFYATDLPDKLPTTLEGLVRLIEGFPSRLKQINNGQGIPIEFELQPLQNIIPTAKRYLQVRAVTSFMEDLENCFDDLRNTQSLVSKYGECKHQLDEDVRTFNSDIRKVLRKVTAAISSLGTSEEKKEIEGCLQAYGEALDGLDEPGKFGQHWKKILTTKVPTTSLKLPEGQPLTVVLFGKTGNGKSSTGNSIIGQKGFKSSNSAQSKTALCGCKTRTDEREIEVIDTPGVLDTSTVQMFGKQQAMNNISCAYMEDQKRILREVARIFALCPDGFHANILVVKYGCKFSTEDGHAMKLLEQFFGPEANAYTILLLSYGDQAEHHAEENNVTVDDQLKEYIQTLPDWVKDFIKKIGNRVVLFNNWLKMDKEPEAYKKQLSKLIQVIDDMTLGKGRFVHKLTHTSKEALEEQISQAMDESGLTAQAKALEKAEEDLRRQTEEKRVAVEEVESRKQAEKQRAENEKKRQELAEQKRKVEEEAKKLQQNDALTKKNGGRATEKVEQQMKADGGCFPGPAKFVDKNGRIRNMDSLQVGEEVLVVANKEIRLDSVITFIHRQPDVMQEYLKIRTTKNKILKITDDHLLFVKTKDQATAVPARDVKIGDTMYVRVHDVIEEDTVQDISSVIEKGVYAPVTLSGTILVNDVLASCYFDVLSHEWSHMAMGIARTLYHVSPWVVQWISSIGQKDGFPGWCRLVHNMLTLLN